MKTAKSFALSGLAAAMLVASPVSFAEEESAISANVTLATDYTFRGISQTDERGAIQGGFDWGHDSGFYAGVWASNVDFDSDGSTEMDYYGGFAGELSEGIGYDVGVIYYDYAGDSEFDYVEFAVALSFGDFSVGLNYSDEFGDGGPEYYVFGADYSLSLTENLGLDLHLGYSDVDEDDFWEAGEDSYVDYAITLSTEFEGVDLSLALVGTDLDETDTADDRVVFSISKSF